MAHGKNFRKALKIAGLVVGTVGGAVLSATGVGAPVGAAILVGTSALATGATVYDNKQAAKEAEKKALAEMTEAERQAHLSQKIAEADQQVALKQAEDEYLASQERRKQIIIGISAIILVFVLIIVSKKMNWIKN